MADDVSKKLDEMRRLAQQYLAEAQAIVSRMNTVEIVFDLEPTKLEDLAVAVAGEPVMPLSHMVLSGVDVRGGAPQPSAPKRGRGLAGLRPDQYFGEEPLEAAKAYMKSVGHAIHFDEIADAVERGGAATRGAGWRDRLELSLKRSPYEVIMVSEKTFGLSEFYSEEQLKRIRDARRGTDADSNVKKKLKPKSKPKPKPKQTTPAAPSKPAEVPQPPKGDAA